MDACKNSHIDEVKELIRISTSVSFEHLMKFPLLACADNKNLELATVVEANGELKLTVGEKLSSPGQLIVYKTATIVEQPIESCHKSRFDTLNLVRPIVEIIFNSESPILGISPLEKMIDEELQATPSEENNNTMTPKERIVNDSEQTPILNVNRETTVESQLIKWEC